ncbi:MAG: hypothetical protein Q9178_008063 [Gyalolechia marmorata]
MLPTVKKPTAAHELLTWDENQFIDLMNKSHTNNHRFNISQITNFDCLSPADREALSQKFANAAKKVSPLNISQVDQLLGALQVQLATAQDSMSASQAHHDSHDRAPIAITPPTEDDEKGRQIIAHDLIIRAGGRPVISLTELRTLSEMAKQRAKKAALFVDLPIKCSDGYIPPVFSSQLAHWNSFQLYWQWGNRGKAATKQGFTAFLAAMKEEYLAYGEEDMVADDAALENMARRMWEFEQPRVAHADSKDLEAYERAVRRRLAARGFTTSFQLLQDPRGQDEWTTWVEYLNFVYWQQERDNAAMKKAEPRYRRAMEELQRANEQLPAAHERGSLAQQLKAATKCLENTCKRFNKIRDDVEAYLKYETFVRRHQLRAEWVLEQLSLIEMGDNGSKDLDMRHSEAKEAHRTLTKNDANAGRPRKRKGRQESQDEDEGDTLDGTEAQPQLKRSRTQADVSTLTAKPRRSQRRTRRHRGDAVVDAQPPVTEGVGVHVTRLIVRRSI